MSCDASLLLPSLLQVVAACNVEVHFINTFSVFATQSQVSTAGTNTVYCVSINFTPPPRDV